MLILFDRLLTGDVLLAPSHKHFATFIVNERITAEVFRDDPMYLSLLLVDGRAMLRESVIEHIEEYRSGLSTDPFFMDFLIEYASAVKADTPSSYIKEWQR